MKTDKLVLAYKAWKSDHFKLLSLDDILECMDISHKDFRQFLKDDDLYALTPALSQEVYLEVIDGQSLSKTQKVFRITWSQLVKAAYSPLKLANEANLESLTKDILDGKLTQVTIADKYNLSQARVSQLKAQLGLGRTRRHRRKLTPDEEAQIKKLPCKEAMEQFDISKTTYYKVVKQ